MEKIDFKKKFKEFYNSPTAKVVAVEVPAMNFLMIDGKGDPNTSKEYKDAIEALYPLAYTIKFDIKKMGEIDYGVLPLEGLWWADDMNDFVIGKKDNWQWTLMIRQPEFVTREIFVKNLEIVKSKKNPVAIDKVRFESYDEGKSVQLMHIGPYADEGANILKMHEFIKEIGKKPSGKHHEIYLSDPRRTAPEKLKTIIRQAYSLLTASKS